MECLLKDREPLLAFYDSSAEDWAHIWTMRLIESTLPRIPPRTDQAWGFFTTEAILTMNFNRGLCTEQRLRKIKGFNSPDLVLEGKILKDGVLGMTQSRTLPDALKHQNRK